MKAALVSSVLFTIAFGAPLPQRDGWNFGGDVPLKNPDGSPAGSISWGDIESETSVWGGRPDRDRGGDWRYPGGGPGGYPGRGGRPGRRPPGRPDWDRDDYGDDGYEDDYGNDYIEVSTGGGDVTAKVDKGKGTQGLGGITSEVGIIARRHDPYEEEEEPTVIVIPTITVPGPPPPPPKDTITIGPSDSSIIIEGGATAPLGTSVSSSGGVNSGISIGP